MRILIDTNVIMDALLGRQPFFAASDTVLKICHEEKAEGFLAAHSVTNLDKKRHFPAMGSAISV